MPIIKNPPLGAFLDQKILMHITVLWYVITRYFLTLRETYYKLYPALKTLLDLPCW